MAENERQRTSSSLERHLSTNSYVPNRDSSPEQPVEEKMTEEQTEEAERQKVIFFAPGDPENPHNWNMVC